MRPTSLYYTLGMDKKAYSEAPEIKYVRAKQGEHYYVQVTGSKQATLMRQVLDMPWTRRDLDVKASLRDKVVSYFRIDILEEHDGIREMKIKVTSKPIIDSNSGNTITIRDFMRNIL